MPEAFNKPYGCDVCRAEKSALTKSGLPIKIKCNYGKGWEVIQDYDCPHCKVEWHELREGGAGGHAGPYWGQGHKRSKGQS